MTTSRSDRPYAPAAALECLASLAADPELRRHILARLSAADIARWKKSPTTAQSSFPLVDALLKEPHAASKLLRFEGVSHDDKDAISVADIVSMACAAESGGGSRAAVSLLLRASATPELAPEVATEANTDKFVVCLKRELRNVSDPNWNTFLVEGLLSVMINSLRLSPDVRQRLSVRSFDELLHPRLFALLVTFAAEAASGAWSAACGSAVARAATYLGKMASHPATGKWLSTAERVDTILHLLTIPAGRLRADGSADPPLVGCSSVTDEVVEGAALTLATITRCPEGSDALTLAIRKHNNSTATRVVDSLFALLGRNAQPKTIGNIALVIPLLPSEVLPPRRTVQVLLGSVTELRSHVHRTEAAIADQVKAGATDAQDTSDLRSFCVDAAAAQKNCSVALSRLAKQEPYLVELREQRGIEILAATTSLTSAGR